MKTTGTPCKKCVHGEKQGYEQPCCWCISDEDIVLAVGNPDHPVDFVHYEPKENKSTIVIEIKNGVVLGVYSNYKHEVITLCDIPDDDTISDEYADELDYLAARVPYILYAHNDK